MPPARAGLVARVRYRFDSALSGGPIVIAAWLGVVTFALGLAAAVLIYVFHLGYNGDDRTGVVEGMWQSLMRLLDPGTLANDSGWALRFIGLMVTLSGIFLASALIGLVATALDHQIQDLRKGRSAVVEDDHTLVLGWSPRLFTIVSELVLANENQKRPAIVVLAPIDKTEMEDELRARVVDFRNTRLVCRTGDPTSPDDLARVNLAGARSIVVLGADGPDGDADVVKTVLAVMSDDPEFERAHVVAEVHDPRYAESLTLTAGHRVIAVQADDIIARVTAQACNQVGLSHVYRELLDFEGDELYFQSVPDLAGHTFGEALLAFDRSSVIGLLHADGTVAVGPPMDTVIAADDEVIAISADDDTIVFTGFREVAVPPEQQAARTTRPVERILIVGWSDLGPDILGDLDPFLDSGTAVDVLYDDNLFEDDPLEETALVNAVMRVHTSDCEANDVAHYGPARPYDQVIVLGYRSGISVAEADARTLLTLLAVRHTWPPEGGVRPRVVAEVLDSRNVAIAQATGVDDFVVSDELSSLMISQLAERAELKLVFDELFDARGSSLGVRPASWYATGEAVPFETVVAVARERGEVAIGYRLADGTVVVNPPKSALLALGPRDDIVTLGRFREPPSGSEPMAGIVAHTTLRPSPN
jgi:hypothetical protein